MTNNLSTQTTFFLSSNANNHLVKLLKEDVTKIFSGIINPHEQHDVEWKPKEKELLFPSNFSYTVSLLLHTLLTTDTEMCISKFETLSEVLELRAAVEKELNSLTHSLNSYISQPILPPVFDKMDFLISARFDPNRKNKKIESPLKDNSYRFYSNDNGRSLYFIHFKSSCDNSNTELEVIRNKLISDIKQSSSSARSNFPIYLVLIRSIHDNDMIAPHKAEREYGIAIVFILKKLSESLSNNLHSSGSSRSESVSTIHIPEGAQIIQHETSLPGHSSSIQVQSPSPLLEKKGSKLTKHLSEKLNDQDKMNQKKVIKRKSNKYKFENDEDEKERRKSVKKDNTEEENIDTQMLVEMGFEKNKSYRALLYTKGDVFEAAELLATDSVPKTIPKYHKSLKSRRKRKKPLYKSVASSSVPASFKVNHHEKESDSSESEENNEHISSSKQKKSQNSDEDYEPSE